jgi:acyl-CoA reductase-like NAD-dependent aldehyde dehydrogenase
MPQRDTLFIHANAERGYKQSGNGREPGRYGLEKFLEYKSLQCRPARHA